MPQREESANLRSLSTEVDRGRFDFMQTEVAVSTTFIEMVHTEWKSGDREAAARLREKAEIAYATIQRFFPELRNTEHRDQISEQLVGLRSRLDEIAEMMR